MGPLPRPRPLSDDTSREAEAVQFRRWSEMSPEAKAGIVAELTLTANRLALAGLRERFPRAGTAELLRRLATARLGETLARQAYGPPPDEHGP